MVATLSLAALCGSEARDAQLWAHTGGYLRNLGPNALRFMEEIAPKAPPPAMPPPAPAMVVSQSGPDLSKLKPAATEVDPRTTEIPVPDSLTGTNQIGEIPLSSIPNQNNEIISPQMLLKYFSRNTNGVSSQVIMPMPMNAFPQNPPTIKSKASYSIGQ